MAEEPSIQTANGHMDLLLRLRGLTHEMKPVTRETPSHTSTHMIAVWWHDVGQYLWDIAANTRTSMDKLMDGKNHGWTGKAAEAFKKKTDEVIHYAEELAHVCDSTFEPKPLPQPSDGGVVQRAPAKDDGKPGFKQHFDRISSDLQTIADHFEDKLPMPPWFYPKHDFKIDWEWDQSTMSMGRGPGRGLSDPFGKLFNIYNGDKNLKEDIRAEEMYEKYDKLGVQTRDSNWYGWHCRMPKDDPGFYKIFLDYHLNVNEEKTCQETAKGIAQLYGDVQGKFPAMPQAPQVAPDPGAGGPGAGGPGAGGPGAGGPGMPPSLQEKPPIPERPDMPNPPESEIGKPKPPFEPKPPDDGAKPPETPRLPEHPKDPHRYPDPSIPGDPRYPGRTPGDRDHDGIPDYKDRWPDDPTRGGIPGGGGSGGIDTGTSTARVGTGGGIGGGIGGPDGGFGGASGGPGTGSGGASGPGMGAGGASGSAGGLGAIGGPGAMSGGTSTSASGVMPMGAGAGGGGQDEQEHQSDTWLHEDDDVWGTNADAPPPVLGSLD